MKNNTPTPSTDSAPFSSAIPSHLGEQLKESVPRTYLLNKIASTVASLSAAQKHGSAVCLITGEPGSGKTFLAGQLVKDWDCPAYFIRLGNADGFIWKDAKRFLVSLGLQLRARYGSEIVGPPTLKIAAELDVGVLEKGGTAGGLEFERVSLSPFQKVLIDVKVNVEDLAGETFLVRVGEVTDITEQMSVARLAQEALLFPLEKLAQIRPEEKVRIVVDSLDDSVEIAKAIPFGPELPGNVTWVLTSQPGDHLDRFVNQAGNTTVICVDLSEPDIMASSIDEAAHYALTRLSEPSLAALLATTPVANRPLEDLAHDLAEGSKGNFLYLYHLINGLQLDAAAGRLDLIKSPSVSALPQGLDGIYQYLLTNRIRIEEHKRDWLDYYVPVLGILAVARAPLTSAQIAAFANLDQLKVDEVLGEVRQFLETTAVPENLAYYIYHGSFADFLLTQDRSRNPYPLRPESFYHAAIADHYQSVDDAGWSRFEDRYALMNLPAHLMRAGKLDQAGQLLRGPFGKRQLEAVGPAQTRADCIRVAQAAASHDQDEVFVQMVGIVSRILSEIEAEWASGQYVLSLLQDEPTVLLERLGKGSAAVEFGGQMLPWSRFLLAERLLDLGATLEAREVLRSMERSAWLSYRAPNFRSTGGAEGNFFDFIVQDDVIAFLARVAQVDPGIAFDLTKRLFPDSTQLPNVRSAWREIIGEFLKGSQATAAQCQKLAETTIDWLKEGGYILGWAGISRLLFTLLARALPAAITDLNWVANAVMAATYARVTASSTTQGASARDENDEVDKAPGIWAAIADVLTGILEVWEGSAVLEGVDTRPDADTENDANLVLYRALAQAVELSADELPPAKIPTVGGRTYRTAALGQLSWALHKVESERWKEYSEAALKACELDAAMLDPTVTAVVRGLLWLKRIPEESIAAEVESLIARHNLADYLKREEAEQAETGAGDVDQQTLAQLEQEPDPYERGRIVLSLWRRNAATRAEIESSLQTAVENTRPKRKHKLRDKTPPKFSDVLAEALVDAVTTTTASWSLEVIEQLDHSRTPGRQEEFQYKETAFHAVRLYNLIKAGDFAEARKILEAQYEEAVANSDLGQQLNACLQAISFDPDLADHWFSDLRSRIEEPADMSEAVTFMVAELKGQQPQRFDDLGPRWVADLPSIDNPEELDYSEVRICKLWGKRDIFRPVLISILEHFVSVLPREVESAWTIAAQFKDELGLRAAVKTDDSPDENNAWHLLGDVIDAAGQIPIQESDQSHEAAHRLALAAIEVWGQLIADEPRWQVKNSSRIILARIGEEDEIVSIQPGPIADFIADFYDMAAVDPANDAETEEAGDPHAYSLDVRESITLGIALAISLKQAEPEWSEARFNETYDWWDTLLLGEPPRSGGLEGMTQSIAEVFASVMDRSFRSMRERDLFELTQGLTRWCLAESFSSHKLIVMQARLNNVDDRDLRSLLLAVVAEGWLEGNDWERASSLARVAGTDALARTEFSTKLRSLARSKTLASDSTKRRTLTTVATDILLSIQPGTGSDTFVDVLSAWLTLRAKEQIASGGSGLHGDRYLRKMADWALASSLPFLPTSS
jgi:hypothetical protein